MKLYKIDSKGKVRVWFAEVITDSIHVNHGLISGVYQTEITKCTGKNIGRANETTPEQQAKLECKALYEKKINRDGYKVDLDDEDALVAPMLALDYSKVPHRVPDDEMLYLSPKLDGVRCLYIPGKGLQSRKGKIYKIPHLEEVLKGAVDKVILDGEIYVHGYRLNQIVSAVKKPNALTPLLEFHVFDVVSEQPYSDRERIVGRVHTLDPKIKAVEQVMRKKSSVKETHDYYVQQGYEGVMIRRNNFGYEHSRSASLFKYKEFEEAEYEITDVVADKEGNAVLVCGDFNAKCRGTDEYRRKQLEDREALIGKRLTVRYQTITEFGIPQFPVGIAVRDYE